MTLIFTVLSQWAWIGVQVFGGCCSNVYIFENMINYSGKHKPVVNAITFAQFLGVSLLSAKDHVQLSKYSVSLKPSKVPLRDWKILVLMHFGVSVLNNSVLKFNVSMPMFIVFRSTSTVVTMIVGYLFGGKSYNFQQIGACIIITVGAMINSIPESFQLSDYANIFRPIVGTNDEGPSNKIKIDVSFLIGVALMIATSILSAFMGIFNERIYQKYGNQWKESLFYTHFLALPLFLVVSSTSIWKEMKTIFSDQIVYEVAPFVSKQMLNLILNVITQYICIRGVNYLVGTTNALTVSVVLLVRKFISLILSVILFDNEFTKNNIIGSCLVLIGAILYSTSPKRKFDLAKKNL